MVYEAHHIQQVISMDMNCSCLLDRPRNALCSYVYNAVVTPLRKAASYEPRI